MKFAFAAACAAMSLAGSAMADTRITATFDAPQSAHEGLIVAHAAWNCAGAACVSEAAPDEAFSIDACKEVAHQFGHVASYTGDSRPLSAKALEKCNTAAAAQPAVGTASR